VPGQMAGSEITTGCTTKALNPSHVPPIYLLAKQPNELTRWKTGKFHFRRFW